MGDFELVGGPMDGHVQENPMGFMPDEFRAFDGRRGQYVGPVRQPAPGVAVAPTAVYRRTEGRTASGRVAYEFVGIDDGRRG